MRGRVEVDTGSTPACGLLVLLHKQDGGTSQIILNQTQPSELMNHPVFGRVGAAVQRQLLPLVVELLLRARHVDEVLHVRGVVHHRVVYPGLSRLQRTG